MRLIDTYDWHLCATILYLFIVVLRATSSFRMRAEVASLSHIVTRGNIDKLPNRMQLDEWRQFNAGIFLSSGKLNYGFIVTERVTRWKWMPMTMVANAMANGNDTKRRKQLTTPWKTSTPRNIPRNRLLHGHTVAQPHTHNHNRINKSWIAS